MSKNPTLTQMQKEVKDFIEERGWYTDNPSELSASIVIELGELLEHYQWKSSFKDINKMSARKKKEIGFEFVDVLVYLIRLANDSNIDLAPLFAEKMEKLKVKYPDGKDYIKRRDEYRKTGKNKIYE